MNECLPLGSLDAPTLRMLLEKERIRTGDLEQEVARLRAAVARQNTVISQLQQREVQRERELRELRTLVAGLTEQNRLLRQQVALLTQENAQLRGEPRGAPPEPTPEVKPATPRCEQRVRKKRAAEHNRGRLNAERATRWETHAAETCPQCGEQLFGGWITRRVQVIDLPARAPLEITEHRILRRQCPKCGKRVMPEPVGLEAGRLGRCRFGPRLIAALTTMRIIERLPIAVIQGRLQREHGLILSAGGIVGVLRRMAEVGQPAYEQLQVDVRGSPAVNADETGWRENGQQSTIWTTSTPEVVSYAHGRRTNEEIDGILGADFGGTIIADCYAAYDHFLGPKQRCWAHLVRDLRALLHEHAEHAETVAWVEGILGIYEQAGYPLGPNRPRPEDGALPEATRAREERARRCEALVLLLCPAQLDASLPYATLAMRLRKHLSELFTFMRDPLVPATNNAAERSLRSLVVARKISGGTRSPAGSAVRMVLTSLCATAQLQGKDPTTVCQQLLLAPPGSPSPLATQRPMS